MCRMQKMFTCTPSAVAVFFYRGFMSLSRPIVISLNQAGTKTHRKRSRSLPLSPFKSSDGPSKATRPSFSE